MNHHRVIETNSSKFYCKFVTDTDEDNVHKIEIFSILISNGRSVWENKRVKWADLISFKPEGLEDSLYSSLLLLIFFNRPCNLEEVKESEIVIKISETLSCNLNFTWKLKQGPGIIITLGTVCLLKLTEDEGANMIISLLASPSEVSTKALQRELIESRRLNEQVLSEYEKVVKEKLEREEELYTKFRLLLNTKKEKIRELLGVNDEDHETDRSRASDEAEEDTCEEDLLNLEEE